MKALALFLCMRLLLVSFLPNQDIHELTGVVALMEHFHDHEQNDDHGHDVSFLDFISKHYADEDHKNEAGHENLPFHHNHSTTVINYFFAPISKIVFGAASYVAPVKSEFNFQQRFSSNFSYSIWQPPKL